MLPRSFDTTRESRRDNVVHFKTSSPNLRLVISSFPLFKVKFGEAADRDSQELFSLICQFVQDFKRAHAELRSGVNAVDHYS